ncbi:Ig-like domain-containing protein [Archangium violaceum]|uniref:Ig-like domain-containing protein n=1 Tax=Archangium violaceum TaxID=83451 RepID=UPI002B323C7E|nr:Ig-like domain-containing protein [Archangium gephyra]
MRTIRTLVSLFVAGLVLASCEPPSEGGTAGSEAGPSLETARGELSDCNGLGPNPPAISITSPASGASLSGTVTLTVDATDDERVTWVGFYVDGRLLVSDTSAPFELEWNTATHGNGPAVLTAVASDTRCQSTTSAPVEVTIENAGIAAYDPTWAAPACATVGSTCDSADLLSLRGPTLEEVHQPNTVGGSCADGSWGTSGYGTGPWLERLVVSRSDGTPFAVGKEVTVQATVQPSSGYWNESLDLYVAADPANPSWTLVATLFPSYVSGKLSTLSATYLMPLSGQHVLRGVYRTNGRSTAPSPCISLPPGGGIDDHDDLVITVGPETDTAPPAVAITAPVSGATLERFVNVTLEASDNFGVHRVELYDGTTLLASYSRPPYSFSWATRTVPNGPHTLTARAYDLTGNVTTSAPVNVVIDNDYVPPQVALLQPVEGATVRETVPLEASANDDRGTVRVEFRVDGRLLDTRYSPPFTLSWNSRQQNTPGGSASGVVNGAHVLSATAYDAGGNASTPSSVNVIVDNDYTAPSETTITSPASGALLSGLVTLEATASDDRAITEVLFYVDNLLIGSDTTAPYSISWDSTEVSNGGHQLNTVALDAGGNYKTSAKVSVQTGNAGNVRYDTSLLVPRCDSATARCDSRELLLGRGGQERNTPNTLDGCVDGNSFDYSFRQETVERIRVIREDGTALAAGKRVRIEVDVRVGYLPADTLDLYHSANAARGTSFTKFAALKPTGSSYTYETLSTEFVLPTGNLQAIRARMQSSVDLYNPQCQAVDNYTDRDDLVFAVAQEADTTPPSEVVLTSPANGAAVTTSVTLTVVASDDFGVAAVDFYDGTTLIGTDTTAPFSVVWNSRNGPNGSRTLTARARDLAGNATVSAPVTVTASNDLSVPVVAITSPADGSRLANFVDLAASASDPEGVTRVEFYYSTQLLSTVTSAPYTYRWYPGASQTGSYLLIAKAYDAAGNVGTSAQVLVTVAPELEPPTVSLTSPAPGARLSKTVSLSADATDNYGVVSRVEFLLDGTVVLGSDTSAPFTFSWNTQTVASGGHTLSARATDPYGNQADSAAVSVTIDNAGPAVALTSPASGATVGSVVTLQASATDDAGVARVEFLVDGVFLASDTTVPYSVAWNSGSWANGSHTLSARAYDSLNNVATSAAVTVTTMQPSTRVSLTSPSNNAYVKGLVPLTATATDDQGVVKVEFYVDGTLLGTDTTAPYELSWDSTLVADGSYTISAKAYGPLGIPSTSLPATVSVDNNAPAVALASPTPGAFLRSTVSISATASDTVGVARVEFYDGTTLIGSDTTVPYSMNWNTTSVTGGAHTLRVKAFDGAGNTATSADVAVTIDNTAPTAAFISPAQNTTVRGIVLVGATASDNLGVARVEFYAEGVLLGTDTSAPFEVSWNSATLADGYRILNAKAYDSAGNTSGSSILVSLDNTPPDVAIASPTQEALLRGTVVITATASDAARVEFYDGATLLGTDATSPYQASWNTASTANGAHTLTAKAFDSVGNTRTSAAVEVTLDNTAPTTAISAPAQGASVRGIVAISATASDNLGVERVEFYAGTTLLDTVTTAPYGVSWDTAALASGSSVTLTTKAYDTAGNVTTSAARTVTVDTTAPTVAITSPANGTSFSFLTFSTTIQASASDNVGVTQVVFYDGGSVIGTDTTAPYSVSWNLLGAAKGNHTLTAKAHDTAGHVTTSAPISVKVN